MQPANIADMNPGEHTQAFVATEGYIQVTICTLWSKIEMDLWSERGAVSAERSPRSTAKHV